MPKLKTDPLFAQAAKLTGIDRVLYLAHGNLDPEALDFVESVKFFQARVETELRHEEEQRKRDEAEPVAKKGKAKWIREQRANTRAHYAHNREHDRGEIFQRFSAAITGNNSSFFRKLADVLDQHAANHEHYETRETYFGESRVIVRDPAAKLAAEIAFWAWKQEGKPLYFDSLWMHLSHFKNHNAFLGKEQTAKRLKSAEVTVRKIAAKIGVNFQKRKPGPRPVSNRGGATRLLSM